METAIANYAKDHGLAPEEVTKETIYASERGASYWATATMDMSARGPTSQALQRALKYKLDLKTMYSIFSHDLKTEFRRAWSATNRSFEFMKATKSTTQIFRKRKDEVGVFKTKLQLQNLLGGTHNEEARTRAANYISMCETPEMKAHFHSCFRVSGL